MAKKIQSNVWCDTFMLKFLSSATLQHYGCQMPKLRAHVHVRVQPREIVAREVVWISADPFTPFATSLADALGTPFTIQPDGEWMVI